MVNSEAAAARENARQSSGRFGEQPKMDAGCAVIVAPLVERVDIRDVSCGDTVWVNGNPVVVKDWVQPNPWHVYINDNAGGQHRFEPDAAIDRSRVPLTPFDDVEWVDASDLDTGWGNEPGTIDTTVRYNTDGYGQVAATLDGVGDYKFHAAYYLGILGNFNAEETLPDGRTKGEALNQWIETVVVPAVDAGITERYGWEMSYGDGTADNMVRPLVWATNTEPGQIDADTASALLYPAQARFTNESDPGTDRCEYPYVRWIDAAVKAKQRAGENALPW